jgi:hypothetical protein
MGAQHRLTLVNRDTASLLLRLVIGPLRLLPRWALPGVANKCLSLRKNGIASRVTHKPAAKSLSSSRFLRSKLAAIRRCATVNCHGTRGLIWTLGVSEATATAAATTT